MTRLHRIWQATVVRLFGGFHEVGDAFVCVHDDGICGGRHRIVRFDWRFVPPIVIRCALRLASQGTGND